MKTAKKVPLETMLKNMNRFDDEADGLYANLNEMIQNGKPPKNASAKEHMAFFDKVMELMSKMRECRLDAQKCAVDAAPFVHARLSAVAIKVSEDRLQAKPEGDMTQDELSDYYNKLRMRPATAEPLIIDNATGEPVEEGEDR